MHIHDLWETGHLPVAAVREPERQPLASELSHVLVIEDDDLVRKVMVTWLRDAGWSTLEASDAETAMALARITPPAIAICDIHLQSGPDGAWLSKQLHALDPTIGIIFATGIPDLPGSLTLRPGVIGYLLKPFGRGEALEQVRLASVSVATRRRQQVESELAAETIPRRSAFLRSVERIKASGAIDMTAALLAIPEPDTDDAKERLADLAAAFGLDVRASGLSVAARFRNLGLEVVPERLLNERRSLTGFERRLCRQHPLDGAEALEILGWRNAATILRCLREQWNGLGYPFSREGDEIPLAARILAAFDTFEAVRAERPHRPALGVQEAIALLEKGSGITFDPAVVATFVGQLRRATGSRPSS